MTSELMPNGIPSFLQVVKYPTVKQLTVEFGVANMQKALFLLVKDFCDSLNVVRNMNENQMIEVAAMLVDECDNFRLEDYQMMFTMGKRGRLVKIMDRVDIQLFSKMMDEYYRIRREASEKHLEEQEAIQKNILYQKPESIVDGDAENKIQEVGWEAIRATIEKIQKNVELEKEKELKKKQIEWANQYAKSQGLNVHEVLRAFGRKDLKPLTQNQEKMLEVYGKMKSCGFNLIEILAERMQVTIKYFEKIVNLEITDDEKISNFINQAIEIIDEFSK